MKLNKDISWWYWAATVPLLAAGLAGYPAGFFAAVLLTAIQAVHFYIREKHWRSGRRSTGCTGCN